MFCLHIWKVKEMEILPCLLDYLKNTSGGTQIPKWASEKEVIITYHCEKCGSQKVEKL